MKILIAEDSAASRRLLEATLQMWGYEVITVEDGAKAWQELERPDAPILAILDWIMPEMDGLEVCRRVRARHNTPYVYIILLTARNRKEDVVKAMEAGADDFILKPFDAGELQARVHAGQRILELQADLLTVQESLRRQATHDPLTSLWNHGAILELLNKELHRSIREHHSLGIIMADLDHFKQVNDTHGHLIGDMILLEVARRLCESLRKYDLVGRYGGEEFMIVAPNCDQPQAAGLAERIRKAIADHPFATPDGVISVTMSLGVTAGEFGTEKDADHLIHATDEALYQAKREGRNRIVLVGAERVAVEPLSVPVKL